MVQVLTLGEVTKAIRAAISDGTLLAMEPKAYECRYRWYGKKCAIGVALSEETLKEVGKGRLNTTGVVELVEMGKIEVVEGLEMLQRLQDKHDAIVARGAKKG